MTRTERILDRRVMLMAMGCKDESLIDALDALESHFVGGLRFVVTKRLDLGLWWIKLVSEDGRELFALTTNKNGKSGWLRLSWVLEEDEESVFGGRTVDYFLRVMLLDFGRIIGEGLELFHRNSLTSVQLGNVPSFESLDELRMKLMLTGDI